MAWNGTGTFTRTNGVYSGATVWAQDAAVPTNITATRFDTHDYDLAQGINACLAKNGENVMTGDLAMGGKNVSNALTGRFTSQVDVSAGSTTHGLQVGASNTTNVSIGDTQIEARNNGAASILYVNGLNGKVQIGTLNALPVLGGATPDVAIAGNGYFALDRYATGVSAPFLALRKSSTATVGGQGLVSNGDDLGTLWWYGSDGGSLLGVARITAQVDAATAAGNIGTRIGFYTSATGSASAREVFRLSQAGTMSMLVDGAQFAFQNTNQTVLYMDSTTRAVLYDLTNSKVRQTWNNNGSTDLYHNNTLGLATAAASSTAGSSMATVVDAGGTARAVGFLIIPQVSQSSNYTLVAGDAAKQIYHPAGAGVGHTYTIPSNASVPFTIGTVIEMVNRDTTNTVAVAITSDTLTRVGDGATGTRTLAVYGKCIIEKITATEWIISGSV